MGRGTAEEGERCKGAKAQGNVSQLEHVHGREERKHARQGEIEKP